MSGWPSTRPAGIENLGDRSHRPRSCPHQIGVDIEVAIARMRTSHPSWGPRRLVFELAKAGLEPVPSESAVYRCLVRLNLIDPSGRRRRDKKWKRWERGLPMELWQIDTVGGFVLADGTRAKALTGVDDHSRFCIFGRLAAHGAFSPGRSRWPTSTSTQWWRCEAGAILPDRG